MVDKLPQFDRSGKPVMVKFALSFDVPNRPGVYLKRLQGGSVLTERSRT